MVVRAAGEGGCDTRLWVGHGDESSRLTGCNDIFAMSCYQNKSEQVFNDRKCACRPDSDAKDFGKFT